MADQAVRPRSYSRIFGRLVFAVVVWGVVSFGGTYSWGYWSLAVPAALLGLYALARTGDGLESPPSMLVWGLIVTGAAIAIQIVPLPRSVFRVLAPGADRFLSDFQLGYAGDPPPWHALSIGPRDTATALALYAAFALFLLGLVRALDTIRLESFVRRLATLGLVVALVGLVQKAVGLETRRATGEPSPLIYGFWQSKQGGSPFGPFVNHNHFAGWMMMVMPLALGYLCAMLQGSLRDSGNDWRRWLRWFVTPAAGRFQLGVFGVLAMGTAVVLTGSRSGIAGFSLAVLIVAAVVARKIGGWPGRIGAFAAGVVLIAGAVQWAGVDSTVNRFMHASVDMPGRLTAWQDTARIIRDFPVFGTGLGTYGLAMLVYQTGDRSQIFFEAHNDYLQIVSDGGILLAAGVLLTLIAIIVVIRRRFNAGRDDILTYWTRVGAVAGLAGIAAQSTLEFSLQLMGNLVMFAVLAALAMHAGRPRRSTTPVVT